MIAPDARVAFLRRMHLFHDLTDEDLATIAGELQEEYRAPGDELLAQGEYVDTFYIIYRGSVRLTQSSRGRDQRLATFVDGDHFGEDELLSGRPGVGTAVVT
ncbi:MAG: cyclic nucleotide-binding domain-containing protein, partial [Anaerolineales bacterium]